MLLYFCYIFTFNFNKTIQLIIIIDYSTWVTGIGYFTMLSGGETIKLRQTETHKYLMQPNFFYRVTRLNKCFVAKWLYKRTVSQKELQMLGRICWGRTFSQNGYKRYLQLKVLQICICYRETWLSFYNFLSSLPASPCYQSPGFPWSQARTLPVSAWSPSTFRQPSLPRRSSMRVRPVVITENLFLYVQINSCMFLCN